MKRPAGCMFCDPAPVLDAAGKRLPCGLETGPVLDPVWGKLSAARVKLVQHGRSPANGEPLRGAETCGTCRHLRRKSFARTYLKCGKGPDTAGPGTDIRARWPACVLWERNETQL